MANSDEERKQSNLFGTLAYKMAMKAASDVPKDETTPPLRAIHKSEEVHLLYDTLEMLGRPEKEVLGLMSSETIGAKSNLVKGSEWIFLSKMITVMERNADWQGLFQICQETLESVYKGPGRKADEIEQKSMEKPSPVLHDDWKLWICLCTAAVEHATNTQDSALILSTLETLKAHTERAVP